MGHMLLFVQVIRMVSEDPQMSRQGSADKMKHRTVTIPQKLEEIWRLESGKNQRDVTASHNIGLSVISI
jgi:hypothetical protein